MAGICGICGIEGGSAVSGGRRGSEALTAALSWLATSRTGAGTGGGAETEVGTKGVACVATAGIAASAGLLVSGSSSPLSSAMSHAKITHYKSANKSSSSFDMLV